MKSSKVSIITCDNFPLMILLKNDKDSFHLETMEKNYDPITMRDMKTLTN